MAASKVIKHYATVASALAGATYPGAVWTGYEFYDRDLSRSPEAFTGTVPATPHRVQLPAALSQTGITATVDGESRTVVSGSTASAGQVAIDRVTGVVTFNSADEGDAFAITLTARETVITASALHAMEAEIIATQTKADALDAGKQPLDAFLTSIAGLGTAANKLIYTTGVDTAAEADLSAFARGLLDDANAAAARATLGIAPDTLTIHVSELDGSDTTGDGSPTAPYATLSKAFSQVLARTGQKYEIRLGPGAFTIGAEPGNMATEHVSLRGSGRGITTVTIVAAMDLHLAAISDMNLTAINTGAHRLRAPTGRPIAIENVDMIASTAGQIIILGELGTSSVALGSYIRNCTIQVNSDTDLFIQKIEKINHMHAYGDGQLTIDAAVEITDCKLETSDFIIKITSSYVPVDRPNFNWSRNILEPSSADVARLATAIIKVEDVTIGLIDDITMRGNIVRYQGAFDELSGNGHVAVVQRFGFDGTLIMTDNYFDVSCLPLMDSHPGGVHDTIRGTSDEPTFLINNHFRFRAPEGQGPGDRIAVVQRFCGGEFISQGNLYEIDSSANTRKDFDHGPIWIHSDGATDLIFRSVNDTFISKLPSSALNTNINRFGMVWFANSSKDPVLAEIINATVRSENYDAIAGQEAAGALSSETWFKEHGTRVWSASAQTAFMRENGVNIVDFAATGAPTFNLGLTVKGTATPFTAMDESATPIQMTFAKYSSSATTNRALAAYDRYRGTIASPAVVINGDLIGGFIARAYDGATIRAVASFEAQVDSTGTITTGSSLPSKMIFQATPDGSVTRRTFLESYGAKDINLPVSGAVYRIGGTQVLGAQQSAIADLAGDGSESGGDVELKINAVLAAMRAHGLIAT